MNIPGADSNWGPSESMICAAADQEYQAAVGHEVFGNVDDDEEWEDSDEEEMLVDESDGELYETLESMALEAEYRVDDVADFTYAWGTGYVGKSSHTRSSVSPNKRARVEED